MGGKNLRQGDGTAVVQTADGKHVVAILDEQAADARVRLDVPIVHDDKKKAEDAAAVIRDSTG